MVAPDAPPLAGLRVLVTRPAHQAKHLCHLIESAGGMPLRFPTIEIAAPTDTVALERLVDRLDEFQIGVFVSPNAVTRAFELIRDRRGDLPPAMLVVSVGPGSARALAEANVRDVLTPGRTDSEGVLGLAPLQQVRGVRVVIFRGEGGRELLGQTLRQRGAQVEYAECYRRRRPVADTAMTREVMQGRVDVVTATSADALRNLFDMLGAPAAARLARAPLVVVSERLRQLAHELGHDGSIEVTTAATDEAIVAAISTIAGTHRGT